MNKLASDELNNTQISDYMKNLGISLPELLNKLKKDKILDYIISGEEEEEKEALKEELNNRSALKSIYNLGPTFRLNNYDEAYKKNMAEKVKDMVFRHVDTINLSMFNFIDVQNENERLLKELINNTRIKSEEDIIAVL